MLCNTHTHTHTHIVTGPLCILLRGASVSFVDGENAQKATLTLWDWEEVHKFEHSTLEKANSGFSAPSLALQDPKKAHKLKIPSQEGARSLEQTYTEKKV